MSQPLAQVLGDLDIPRGPDLAFSTQVPSDWFRPGTVLRIALPERLSCAECQGGGCDRCDRKGAIRLREADEEQEIVRITLPQTLNESNIQIRLPHAGGYPLSEQDEALPRGHLIVSLRSAEMEVDPENSLVSLGKPAPLSEEERRTLARKSIVVIGSLVILFVFLLRLSGWI